ncbi:c-type cytochrome biogenesis protein CcsB [Desulfatiferula olefinivorans]
MTLDVLSGLTAALYVTSSIFYVIYLFLQKDPLQKVGLGFLAAGLGAHTLLFLIDVLGHGYLPVYNLRLTLSLASWSSAAAYLWLRFRYRIKVMGVYAAPLVAFVFIVSLKFPEITEHAADVFKSAWLVIHVITVFVGEGCLAMACGAGILYLIQERAIKSKKRGFFYSRLPSLELLDAVGYACVVVGFSVFTLGLIVGLIYAKLVWHRFAGWDPKEIWSGISWLIYAALVHERIAVGWRGRRAAVLAVVAFAVLMFSFLGVNILMDGHHGVFTQFRPPRP